MGQYRSLHESDGQVIALRKPSSFHRPMLRALQTAEGPPRTGVPAAERRRTGFSFMTLLAVPIAILVSRKTQRALLGLLVLNLSWQLQKHFFLQ